LIYGLRGWAAETMSKPRGKIPRITFRAPRPVSLTDADWERVEAAYGQPVPREIRAQIKKATNQFLQFAEAENTGSINDAIKRASRLQKCARSLIAAINERAVGDQVREYVEDELARSFATLNSDPRLAAPGEYARKIYAELCGFVNACDLALRRLHSTSKFNYWQDGWAWQVWIRQLTDMLLKHGSPTAVRKDTDKEKSDRASPFVSFVYALQTFIPKEHIRAQHSKGALAVAIHKARQDSKPPVAPRKTRTR
jgi:hypothetical protein